MNIIKTKEDIKISIISENDAEELFLLIDRNREYLSQVGEGTAKKYPDF